MKCYKGFDKDLKCRSFQFEVGKEYEEEKADICECGFHACENPLDVLSYYNQSGSRYCEVDLDANDQKHDDSKRVGKHIKIVSEIGPSGLVKAHFEYVKCEIGKGNSATSGNYANSATLGDYSKAEVKGKNSIAAAIGINSSAAGALGCFIAVAEWEKIDDEWVPIGVKAAKVDGAKIKPNTFYKLVDGQFVECE